MKCRGLILAGGASRRMGRPKALLAIDGQTFVYRLITIFRSICDEVIVVVGYNAEPIRQAIESSATIVINPEPVRGQLSSLQCGLRALPAGVDSFLFTPVDYPAIQPDTPARLIAAAEQNPQCKIAVPRYAGRRGHPVFCRVELAAEFLALDERSQARDVIHRYLDQAVYVDVDDPGTVMDVDDPAAYERLLASRL